MGNTFSLICLILMVLCVFTLGRRWESYVIKNALVKSGVAETRWGESGHTKYRIEGVVILCEEGT